MISTQNSTFISTIYKIWKNVYAFIQIDAKINNFVVVIKRSILFLYIKKKQKYVFVCNRNTTYKSKFVAFRKRRNVNTITCDCFWKVTVQHYKTKNQWKFNINLKKHNHEFIRASAHAIHRKQKLIEKILNFIAKKTKVDKSIYNLYK